MGLFYPQAKITLGVIWEDFNFGSQARLQKVYPLTVFAKRVTMNINDYTQADTFDCEIDYKNFPFDPRAIRACRVTVHMADAGELSEIEPNSGNVVFVGFADEESISFDDSSRVVKLEGRDQTSLLIDRKYTGGTINVAENIETTINQILQSLPETQNLRVDNRVGSLPVVGQFSPHRNSASKLGTQRSSAKDESCWDVIQDMVARAGLIAYIELDKLVISKPRVLYGNTTKVQFVYGRNLKNLEFKRKIGRKKNFNVNVRSLNTDLKEALSVEIPLEATDEWSRETGIPQRRVQIPTINADGSEGTPKDAPILGFRVPNVNDKNHLVKVAQEIYEELGRQQLDGSFTTKDMESVDSSLSCFNLLKLRNGTPVSVTIDQGDLEGIRKVNGVNEKTKFLINRCYEPVVARVFAETLSNTRFDTPFYTKSVQFTLSEESGFQVKVDFLNFIEIPARLGGNG